MESPLFSYEDLNFAAFIKSLRNRKKSDKPEEPNGKTPETQPQVVPFFTAHPFVNARRRVTAFLTKRRL